MNPILNKSLFVYSLTLSTISLGAAEKTPIQKSQINKTKPNIVFILADDMGIGDINALNPQGKIQTNNLNSMVHNGMTFTDAHTSSSVCTPSRYGIITGRYSWRSQFKGKVLSGYSPCIIPKSRSTVASLLKNNGYNTALIGKWHLGLSFQKKDGSVFTKLKPNNVEAEESLDLSKPIKLGPVNLGFDYFFGISGSWNMPPFAFIKNNQLQFTKLIKFKGPIVKEPEEITIARKAGATKKDLKNIKRKYPKIAWNKGFKDEKMTPYDAMPTFKDKTIEYIQKQQDTDKPFFLFLSLPAPHCPIVPNKEFVGTSNAGLYGDYVIEVDDFVGSVIKTLKSTKQYNNTLIIFTADNGYSIKGFPNFQKEKYKHNPSYIYAGQKTSMLEGGHRVPFIALWPDKIKSGSTCRSLVSLMDLYATCANIVNAKIPTNAAEDSFSFLPDLLQNGNHSSRTNIVHQNFAGYLGVRQYNMKLIMSKNKQSWALYDLKKDLSETDNLISKMPEKVKNLQNILKNIIQNGRSTPGPAQKNDTPNNWKQIYWLDE